MKKVEELKELRSQNDKDLYKEISTLNHKLSELEFKASFRKVKNYREIRQFKKRIARIWTILAEKTLIEMKNQQSQEEKG